jgi:demethylmenaquinone methyltransferase/2-methoxy-6-polyprenyl-1,4-benzoquinol methylase
VLDVSTGTGETAIEIIKRFEIMHLTSEELYERVVALDPSSGMLLHAKLKLKELEYQTYVKLIQSEAEKMIELSDNTFDKVTMSFGIRNVLDRSAALKEIKRVMKNNGVVAIMEFQAPEKGFLAPLAILFLRYILPGIGSIISRGETPAYFHLRDSIFNFPSSDQFQQMMMSHGFHSCHIRDIFFNIVLIHICRT